MSRLDRLLGFKRAFPKVAYASQLFGNDPQSTFQAARTVAASGYRAAKFGWGPYGRGSVEIDADHVCVRRRGRPDPILLVDAGTVWAMTSPWLNSGCGPCARIRRSGWKNRLCLALCTLTANWPGAVLH